MKFWWNGLVTVAFSGLFRDGRERFGSEPRLEREFTCPAMPDPGPTPPVVPGRVRDY